MKLNIMLVAGLASDVAGKLHSSLPQSAWLGNDINWSKIFLTLQAMHHTSRNATMAIATEKSE